MSREFEVRLMARIDHSTDCWLWTGAKSRYGYGKITREGLPISTHRASWELAHGAIPDGLFVLHRCDVRNCCNPAHLFLGTQADNMRDMSDKGRGRRSIQTCINGHPFSERNTGTRQRNGRTQRVCRACDVVRQTKSRKVKP